MEIFSLENLGWKLENIVCIELMRRYKPLFCDVFYFFILCFGLCGSLHID